MKYSNFRAGAAVFLLTLLTACGGGHTETAAPAMAAAPAPNLIDAGTSPLPASDGAAVAPTNGTPLPDCHPEQCAGLRIIDGNAESYRFDALRRTAESGGAS